PVRGAGVGSGAGVAAAVTPAVAPVSPLVAPVPTDEARPAYPGTAPVPRSAPDRLDELADLRPAAPMGPVAPDAHRIALDAPPAPTDPGPFPVDTSSEANFWRSVARALPVRVKTPTQVAEFINKAPRAKDRAPNGRHWTGKDVTERWVGMPAAYGGAVGTSGLAPGPTSATKPTTTRTAATPAPRPPSAPGNGGALLAGVGSLLGLLVCAGAGATWLFGGGEDTVLPAAPPATTPVEPASPSPAAPAPAAPEPKATPKPKPAAPALDAKPKVAPGKTPAPVPATPASPGKQPRDTTPAGQGGDAPIRTVPGPAAPASPGSPRSKTVLTDNDEIFAMAKAVINMSSVQLQACYDQRIKEVEDLKGAWSAAFTIAKDGTTKSVAVEGVNLSDAPLEACMTAAIADWRFERIAKEQPVKKTYRFGAGAW
ncbi:MAG: AgmX/PglI C-terminal domain-containing protein, partial [Pseudomonadota bacterium]|nr:AgmX/PglI C-terminal domain-containing protein [Pseudomonadota bacterium]